MLLSSELKKGKLYYTVRCTSAAGESTNDKLVLPGSKLPDNKLSDEVRNLIQLRYYYKRAAKNCARNISIIEKCISTLQPTSLEDLTRQFPRAYQVEASRSGTLLYNDERKSQFLQKYKTDPLFYPEDRKLPTKRGDMVRSKGEMMIADSLYDAGILYVYEPKLIINGIVTHPDFVILFPYDSEETIWEHFGMMDDQQYRRRNINKLSDYFEAGYLPGVNLITTFEDTSHMLPSHEVTRIIDHWVYRNFRSDPTYTSASDPASTSASATATDFAFA